MSCSTVQVLMLSGPLLLIAIASPLPDPQTGSHYPPRVQTPAIRLPISMSESNHQAPTAGPGWDQDTNIRERDGSRTQTGGVGRARESSLRERAGAGQHNLSRATLYSKVNRRNFSQNRIGVVK